MQKRLSQTKRFFLKHGGRFLPFLFTFGNAFFGFCSIVLALEGEKIAAGYCIFLSAMMDALDGRVARLMKAESELGVELDSLCDAISFCLAPAFLMYVWYLRAFGFVGIVFGALFLLAGLFRLARFNVTHDEQSVFFIGLPTTIAGCFVVVVLLNSNVFKFGRQLFPGNLPADIGLAPLSSAVFLLVLSWLMVSSVRFPTFKQGALRIKRHSHVFGAIMLFVVLAVMQLKVALLALFLGYFVVAFGYRFLR